MGQDFKHGVENVVHKLAVTEALDKERSKHLQVVNPDGFSRNKRRSNCGWKCDGFMEVIRDVHISEWNNMVKRTYSCFEFKRMQKKWKHPYFSNTDLS